MRSRSGAVLIFAGVFAAAGCGGSDRRGSSSGDPSNDASTTDAPVTAPDSASVDAGPVVLPPIIPGEVTRPATPPNIRVLLDRQPLALASGSSSAMFDVPPDAISITVTVEGESDAQYVLASWVDAADKALVAPGWESRDPTGGLLCVECTNRVAAAEATFAALAPNNQDASFETGQHTIEVSGFRASGFGITPADGTVSVTVHAKTMSVAPATGQLNLNLHFTGAGGFTAATAPSDPEFQSILDGVRELYGQAGISLGALTYRDIDPSFEMLESIQGPNSDLMRLFEQSGGSDNAAVNVFFVDSMMLGGPYGGYGVVLGIAGGIPGPALVHGTPRSGVAIAIGAHSDPQLPPGVTVTNTMAHEVGHFLGLFHTSEQAVFGPQIHDPIADTLENDPNNVMYNTGEGSVLSDWQGIVMRSNPWIQHPEVAQ